MSLKRRITLTICSIIIFILIIMSYIIYNKSATIINHDAENLMKAQLDRAQENIDLLIKITQLETEKLALDLKVKSFLEGKVDAETLNKYLTILMNEKNNINNIYMDLFILNEEGRIVSSTMAEAMNLDLSTREYFQESQTLKKTVTSDILIAKSDGTMIIITVSPIMNSSNQVLSYAGIAIYAEYLSDFIKNFQLGKTGYYVIIDSNNLILSHPKEKIIATEATDMNYYIPNEFRLNRQYSTVSSIAKKNYDGLKELQIYKLIESNQWILIAVLPESEMQEKSLSLLIYVITIGIIATILAIFVGTYISNKISVPIVAITKYINNAAQGNILISKSISDSINSFKESKKPMVPENDEKSKDEISNLTRSLKNLREYLASIVYQFKHESEQIIKTSQDMSRTIEESSARTATFISVLSHDLKTSITLIKGYAKGIMSGAIKDDEVKKKFIEGIYHSAEDIEKITCDILDSAYEAQNAPKLYTEKISSSEFASKIFETAKQYILDSQRKFEGINAYGEGTLQIDSIKISRAWNNLLNNAVKFSAEGSVIKVYILQEDKKLIFKVIDEGIGIAEKEMDKIFNMFYKGHDNDKMGFGLGLFIAKSFIEAHDSKLHFTSEWQKGSEFWFDLDILDEEDMD
ncbi:ATP-binding protein [Alkaliphilus peptidifermentans]|uniref:histidine kinase n=1 Tax=Alkaliphilus peptidifermentans DSM 18978 TaxID=1120976 RepID=A0A1G5HBX3_9FIRM|nr:ATP-binding protein [Alkaliphilus peptidifermentans]SCY61244.1 His Kinase A (phospho-acceptor) domain-containing protein [Alkaliphilus peptidifermentans DSM 18978]